MCNHFGLEDCLQRVLENTVASAHGVIEVQIHTDGLPVQGLEATIMANFGSHCKTNIIRYFDKVFGGN